MNLTSDKFYNIIFELRAHRIVKKIDIISLKDNSDINNWQLFQKVCLENIGLSIEKD